MHIQDSQWSSASAVTPGVVPGMGTHPRGAQDAARSAPLRVDAQRNLEHVLRAAREVFGELGYGAPMEDVARRARVGVGTVYRRFPSKDVLVRRIAEEETARLTEQARTALGQEDEPWSALARFLRTSVASGAGRLLPPQILRVGADEGTARDEARVPQQRQSVVPTPGAPSATLGAAGQQSVAATAPIPPAQPELRLVATARPDQTPKTGALSTDGEVRDDAGASGLLEVVGRLVDRARGAGALRDDVTVADVLLVIATAAPSLPDPAQQAAASSRLLDILLEGLRSRPV
ncbi:TetR/AcrR family transcriptional regulator [Streptomyces tsukubensis]|uniref:TetR family transcriptional regulator n=1 Tax=Streptomyces tsukubensis TaxID=83656 RepID=A0A1V4A5M5_9ACTN|nr:TetR/AcrR family transcriptional regulator [Streptomyces tsukubensis]OON75649.1 TetR family transcriptional regulator [Streptomyces tsukubensis]QFR94368.1 TetR family transcriptional regulator [Streptomyces tsukubensis]